MKHWGIVLLLCLGVVACSSDKKIAPKEGRINLQENVVIPKTQQKVQLAKADGTAVVDTPFYNNQNKYPTFQNLTTTDTWKNSDANGQEKNGIILPAPIAGKKNIYTVDGTFVARAHDRLNGQLLWETPLSEKAENSISLVKNGTLLVALSSKGKVVAFNTDGKILWQKDLNAPFRNNAVLEKNTLYLLSANNDVWALNSKSGKEKWHYKTDAPITFLQQMGTPAVSGSTLIVPFSSGLVMAFDKETGAYLWEQDMTAAKTFDHISDIAQMTASPVIDGERVYLLGHANKSGAFSLKDGGEIWTIAHGGQLTPLISGNTIFILNSQNSLLALDKNTGHLFWQQEVPQIKGKKTLLLLDGKIIIIAHEKSVFVNALTGEVEKIIEMDFDGSVPTLTQDGWYYLRKNGKLIHQGQIQ